MTVNVVNCPIGVARDATGLPSVSEGMYQSENIESGQSTMTAQGYGGNGGAWVITVTGNDVYLRFGPNPTAAIGDILVLNGQTREFWARPGDKVSVLSVV